MTSVALLDVNVLVALFDPDHIHHDAAHSWFAEHRAQGWATSPITENGLVRVLAHPAYAGSHEPPAGVIGRLALFLESGAHVFWADEISLCDKRHFGRDSAATSRQVTDIYLLALAKHHRGRLATFDTKIPLGAVPGAESRHLEVIPA